MKIAETELIEKMASKVSDKETGTTYMFKHMKLDELELMYKLFKRVPDTLPLIIANLKPYIEERGETITKDENLLKDPIEFTKKLLGLKKEMDDMIEQCFENNMHFQKARDSSFQNFMNECA